MRADCRSGKWCLLYLTLGLPVSLGHSSHKVFVRFFVDSDAIFSVFYEGIALFRCRAWFSFYIARCCRNVYEIGVISYEKSRNTRKSFWTRFCTHSWQIGIELHCSSWWPRMHVCTYMIFFTISLCSAYSKCRNSYWYSTTTPQIEQVSARQQSYRNYIIRNVTGPIVCRMDRTCVPRSMLRFFSMASHCARSVREICNRGFCWILY